MVDWTKPIQHRNGERCELIETRPEGYWQFSGCTRMIRRLDVDTSTTAGAMSSIWWMKEDGKSGWPEFDIVNRLETEA